MGGGEGGEGGGVSVKPCFDSKFHGKFWINLKDLGYCVYPKCSHPLLFT